MKVVCLTRCVLFWTVKKNICSFSEYPRIRKILLILRFIDHATLKYLSWEKRPARISNLNSSCRSCECCFKCCCPPNDFGVTQLRSISRCFQSKLSISPFLCVHHQLQLLFNLLLFRPFSSIIPSLLQILHQASKLASTQVASLFFSSSDGYSSFSFLRCRASLQGASIYLHALGGEGRARELFSIPERLQTIRDCWPAEWLASPAGQTAGANLTSFTAPFLSSPILFVAPRSAFLKYTLPYNNSNARLWWISREIS